MTEGKKNLVVSIDEELHHRLKVYCAEQNTTIKELIMKLIRQELKKSKERI